MGTKMACKLQNKILYDPEKIQSRQSPGIISKEKTVKLTRKMEKNAVSSNSVLKYYEAETVS